ncbi:MAG: hypothetical protein ACFBSF_13560 [Leptolyngbyaceae cyanobacterium]
MKSKNGKYTLKAYQVLLKTNRTKRLLVEGKDDRQFFKLLINEFSKLSEKKRIERINIDSASDFISSDVSEGEKQLGNREIVERICQKASNTDYAHRLVGFVDREFRGFNYLNKEEIKDDIQKHNINLTGRVIWSRGHSIENYFFDRTVLSETLRLHISEEWFEKTMNFFEQYFEQVIILGCAVSMATRQIKAQVEKKFEKIGKCIDWKMLNLDGDSLLLNNEGWKSELIKRKILTLHEAEKILQLFFDWKAKLETVNFDLVRWLCHGHIGFKFILSFFKFCIVKTCPDRNLENPDKYLGNFKDDKHFNFCVNVWLKRAIVNECEHPMETFNCLGFELF